MFPFCGLFSGSLIWKFPLLWIFFFEMVLENVKITGRTGYNSISQSLAASSWQIWDSVCVYACVYTCVRSMWVCTHMLVCACAHACTVFVLLCVPVSLCMCVHCLLLCAFICTVHVYVCTCVLVVHVCVLRVCVCACTRACMCVHYCCVHWYALCVCVCWWCMYVSSVHVCVHVHMHVRVPVCALLLGALICTVHMCWCMHVCCVCMHVCTCAHACMCVLTCCTHVPVHAWPVCHLPRAPLFSTVRYRMQQPPADPPWPRTGAPEEVPCSAAGGRLCQGPQAAGHFPEEWTAQYLFYPDKKCYFQRGIEARGSENAAARLL